MTDIERELRALGERVRDEQAGSPALSPRNRTRIKLRRLGTVTTGLVVAAALAFGGTFAAANLGGPERSFGPTDGRDRSGPALGTFFAEFATGRITVVADGETGIVCAATEDVGGTATLSRIEIVGADVLVPIYPRDEPVDVDREDFECISDVPEDFIRSMTGAPELYSLSIEGPSGTEEVPLELAQASNVPDRDRCTDEIPFEPTYLPDGWSPELQPGNAAGLEDIDIIVGHYGVPGDGGFEKMGTGFLDVQANLGDFEVETGAADISVLGKKASLIGPNSNGGYSVRFGHDGCVYSLGGNATRETIKSFAEGFRLKSEADEPSNEQDFAAIWPEDNRDDARDACASAAQEDVGGGTVSIRQDPESVALEFGALVLGWEEPAARDAEHESYGTVLELRRDGFDSGPRGPAVLIGPTEIIDGCWSVGWVSRMPDEQPKHDRSMAIRGRDVSMGFDPGGATSAVLEVGYGGEATTYVWHEGEAEGVEFRLDFDPHDTGHYLILLMDPNGEVFSAFGSPLPEGDFAAG